MAFEASAMPRILLISLKCEPYFDEMYGSLIQKIRAKAMVQRVRNHADALNALSGEAPYAILITDAELTKPEYSGVWDAVLKYVSEGGTAVCMAQFSSEVSPLELKPFFRKAGLHWEAGAYERTTVALNRNAVDSHLAACLPPRYSQKALFLKNVEGVAKWYSPSNMQETPVALAKVQEGKLGYVGDVNGEDESEAVVLAMCGLTA